MDSPGPSSSPSACHPRVEGMSYPATTGMLRTKISLGKGNASLVIPFHLMKADLPRPSAAAGSTNLLRHYGMEQIYNRFCGHKKLRGELSAFLPHLPGNIDFSAQQDASSLKGLIDKPPIGGKEILPLSTTALGGFRLHPGAVPEPYKVYTSSGQDSKKQKKRHKRSLDESEKEDAEIERKMKKEKDKKKKRKKEKKKKIKNSPPPSAPNF